MDMLRLLEIEYAAVLPGSTFRGIHDSAVNYTANQRPELILCNHEMITVSLARGYARATGRPMAAIVHNVVGLLNTGMTIYDAWCDRVPVLVLGGTGPVDATRRRPWIDWIHTANVQGNLVRDFTKWDDQPASLTHFGESAVRAYKIAMTPPTSSACATSAIAESITARRVRHSPIRTSTSRNWRRAWVFMPKVRSRIRTNSRQRCAAQSLQ